MKKKTLMAVAVACIIGAAIALLSTSQYLRIQKEGLEQKSFCAISDVVNCDLTNASSYATFAGIPIAWLGFITYVLIGGMAALGAFSSKRRQATITMAWFLALFAVLYSLRMAYVLVFVLEVICVECVAMYLINILVVVLMWFAVGIPLKRLWAFFVDYAKAVWGKPSQLGFAPKFVTHAMVMGLAFGIGWMLMYNKVTAEGRKEGITLEEKLRAYEVQSLHDIKIDPQWPLWGNPDARVIIVEYSEFECPFCQLSAFNFRPYLQEFKKDICYYFVHYPLDNQCNPHLNYPMHPKACLAAQAAVCAQEQGDFWEFHDELFRLKKNLNKENILKLAQKHKLDMARFEQCWESPAAKERIRADIENGHRIHVTGVPSIFVNGRKLKFWRDPKYVQAVIREEIKRSEKQ